MKMRTETIVYYTSDDGTRFNTEQECIDHENKIEFEHQTITLPYRRAYASIPLGSRLRDIELYSTEELADKASLSSSSTYVTEEIIIDERYWKELMEEHNVKTK